MFPAKKYNEVIAAIHDADGDKVKKFYQKYSKEVVTLPCLPDPSKGLMIKVLPEEQFDEISDTWKHPQFPLLAKGDLIQGPAHETPGVLVSVWMKTKDGHPGQISLHAADLLIDCLGKGFGSRA